MGQVQASYGVVEVVRQALLADSATAALVEDRVLAAFPELTDAGEVTFPCVVISAAGGSMRRFGRFEDLSLDLVAYSQVSPGAAAALYDAVAAALQAERLTLADTAAASSLRVVVAEESARGTARWDGGYRAWGMAGRWLARGQW